MKTPSGASATSRHAGLRSGRGALLAGFDHLILTVGDIEWATRGFTQAGFDVVERDDRSTGATVARFVVLPDASYIMILQFTDGPAASRHRLAPVAARGDGWADYALRTDRIEDWPAILAAASLPVRGPLLHSAELALGAAWAVTLVLAGHGAGRATMPFLVQDAAPRHLRVPMPAAAPSHAAILGIAGVTLVTADLTGAAAGLAVLFGPAEPSPAAHAGAAQVLRFHFATRWVDIAEIAGEPSPLYAHHCGRGEGVFAVTLTCATADRPSLAICGARIDFVAPAPARPSESSLHDA